MKEAIGVGETVLQAQETACEILGVETHEVDFEVLQVPVKKALGIFGKKMAKVKAIVKDLPNKESAKIPANPTNTVYNYLKDVLQAFGVEDLEINKQKESDNSLVLSIFGKDLNTVIGKHGNTLDALQYLANLVANNGREDYFRVKIDIGDYREKREKALEKLGSKVAIKALTTQKEYLLEPMSSYDRRIIHMSVQKYKGVISRSQGEGVNRHIIIAPEGE
ncbi:MAG: protein jag [Oscillospiraceae bacterium]|jgi:spoIIIJ-associated protein|nr:protein jag [Oscillospiraceae bacterium]